MRKVLGLFGSARRLAEVPDVAAEAEEQEASAPEEGTAVDQELADAELMKRHTEIVERVRGFADALQRLSECGSLSDWLDMPIEATFRHHRLMARENIALQHTVAGLQGQVKEKDNEASSLKDQVRAATEQIETLEAHIGRLEYEVNQPVWMRENVETVADLEQRIEIAEDSAQQWYAYAQNLEQEITEARREAQQSLAEITALKVSLDEKQHLIDRNKTSFAEQLSAAAVFLEEQDRAMRKKLEEASEINRSLDQARAALVQKVQDCIEIRL